MAKKGEQDPPFSKVKLEGPRMHHDNHGRDASDPEAGKRGNKNPNDMGHWEKRYSTCAPSENMIATEGADFNAKRARDRKTTYVKVNECDH